MKTLYISDLDGTLLNDSVELSKYTIDTLNALLQQGIHFTIATARTAASVTTILAPLAINIPVILMNGVLLYDLPSKKYLNIQGLSINGIKEIIKVLKVNRLTGFMYEVKDNMLTTYYERLESKAMQEFYDERVNKYQKSFIQVADFSMVDPEHIIYFALLDSKEHLEPAYHMLASNPNVSMAFYQDIYSEGDLWYLEIFGLNATKYNAACYLRTQYQFDKMIGFGDNLNDLPLFRACDETCAVANAKDEVKAVANHIIESNLNEGVAHWIAEKVMKHTYFYETTIGKIGITDNGSEITGLYFSNDQLPDDIYVEETTLLKEAAQQLADYFSGRRITFDLPLAPAGTEFQQKVWKVLQEIPYGETWSYKQVAIAIGNPNASRAVGMANNKNPIAIFIPCHRVIGANGKLVGYAGGLDIKEQLLEVEQQGHGSLTWKN